MNNLDITKNLICNNIKGSFITVAYRTLSEESPFDFLSKDRIMTYLHVIIKDVQENSFYFPDILSDIVLNDGLNKSFNFLTLNKNLHNSAFYITGKEIENLKNGTDKLSKTKEEITNDNADIIIKNINDIFNNPSMALLYLKDSILDGYAHLKINYMSNYTLPVYKIRVTGNYMKEITLLNPETQEDILQKLSLKKLFKDTFEDYI